MEAILSDKVFFGNNGYETKVAKYLEHYLSNKPVFLYRSISDNFTGGDFKDCKVIEIKDYLDNSALFTKDNDDYYSFNKAEWELAIARIRERMENWKVKEVDVPVLNIQGKIVSDVNILFTNGISISFAFYNKAPYKLRLFPANPSYQYNIACIIDTMSEWYINHREIFTVWFNSLLTYEQKVLIMEEYVKSPAEFNGIRQYIRS